ncbi:nicotinate-mononucleotide:5,6-dimethylbenzimidazole phosphoribosyltransferase CobT [Thioflavicoccus mobilis 8321]|uniref:Nicotinate-mononucleotide:5, 6-dimethylbenzimidazole phosphoribosyltransferase CobT n=1 Tax=Thioflavicoccus mobilis 8321 TaxID=765912 RepID=L0GV92_9GAMM|nr:PRC-barrel domain-containing protein [Thioflavicoccus mobilis]AGA89219.1 nicotinate-mononucleotide:5,6-dimethylbenzimidazole phosphoribosyltransferase CobT [Thioflavicoccus mobilis 8321]
MKAPQAARLSSLVLAMALVSPAIFAVEPAQQTDASSMQDNAMDTQKTSADSAMATGTSSTDSEEQPAAAGLTDSYEDKITDATSEGTRVEQVTGMKVVNGSDEEIGEVSKVVRGKEDGELSAVVSVGGFLGIGDKEVVVPLKDLTMKDDKLMAPDDASTEEQLKSMPEYEESDYEAVWDRETVEPGSDSTESGSMDGDEQTGAMSSGDEKGGAVTDPESAHASSEDNMGAVNQAETADENKTAGDEPTEDKSATEGENDASEMEGEDAMQDQPSESQ